MSPAVEFDDVSLRFGDVVALDGISLRIEQGERVALVGPSGAGKSSLISILNTSVRPTGGAVSVLGRRPAELDGRARRELRSRIGTVHQSLHLPGSLRVVHNVTAGRLGRCSTGRALRSLVRPVDTGDVRAALDSLGIADKMWERTDVLSGGERQRVAIARVLMQRPDLVVADEPVASLDPARSRDVVEVLLEATADRPDRTIVVSLHAFDLAVDHFDRIVGLRRGRIVFDEPASALRDGRGAHAAALYDLADQTSPR